MRLPDEILKSLDAATDIAGRDTTAAWLRAAASVLEICAQEIRDAAAANDAAKRSQP